MNIDITFTCQCGAFFDEIISCEGPDIDFDTDKGSRKEYWHQFVCDGCSKDYDAKIICTLSETFVYVPNVIDLSYDVFDSVEEDQIDFEFKNTNQIEIFKKVSKDVVSLLRFPHNEEVKATLNNMLYAQVVTAIEAYLSSSFISIVMNSDELIRKLVETDPELAKRQFSLKEIFSQWNELKNNVAMYLKDLIFHDLKKIKPMYRSILNVDFGDIGWLFKAVLIRHDCVHRNGFNKDGIQNQISDEVIIKIVQNCTHLVSEIEEQLLSISGT